MSESRAESIPEPTRRGAEAKGKRRVRSTYRSPEARRQRAERTEREAEGEKMIGHDPMPWIEQPAWWPQKVADFRVAVLKEGGPELSADPEEAWLQLLLWEWEEAGRRLKTDPGHLKRMAMVERIAQAGEQQRIDLALEIFVEAEERESISNRQPNKEQ